MKEYEVITSIREKSENAADLLLENYRPLIRYIVVPFLHNDQDVEECIHDIVLRICDRIDLYDPTKGSWKAWIITISRNTALNKARSIKAKEKASISFDSADLIDIPSGEPSPEEIMLKNERRAAISAAIDRLTSQEKVLFFKKYYYQQPMAQIAAELGITTKTVEGRLYRIRKKLQKVLGGLFDE